MKCMNGSIVTTVPLLNVLKKAKALFVNASLSIFTIVTVLLISSLLFMTNCRAFHLNYIAKHKAEVCASCVLQDSTSQTHNSYSKDTAGAPLQAHLNLLLHCDSMNNVVLTNLGQLYMENGKLNAKLDSNKLIIDILTDSVRGKIYHKESIKYIHDQVVNPINLQLKDSVNYYIVRFKKAYSEQISAEAKLSRARKWITRLAISTSILFLLLGFLVWLRFK